MSWDIKRFNNIEHIVNIIGDSYRKTFVFKAPSPGTESWSSKLLECALCVRILYTCKYPKMCEDYAHYKITANTVTFPFQTRPVVKIYYIPNEYRINFVFSDWDFGSGRYDYLPEKFQTFYEYRLHELINEMKIKLPPERAAFIYEQFKEGIST
jgi:hypothetical protein